MMSRKGYGRNLLWPISTYCHSTCLDCGKSYKHHDIQPPSWFI